MRCAKARNRLNQLSQAELDLRTDSELLSHIEGCSECALQYQTAQDLQAAFSDARVSDDDGLEFEHLKTRVNARVDLVQQPGWRKLNIMSRLRQQISKSPRLSMSMAIILLAVGVTTLIPFKYDRTIGYEVAVAGVDKELALNEVKMGEFLLRLGVEDAIVDVTGCDTTCNIIIRALKNPDDAQLIKLALSQVNEIALFKIRSTAVSEECIGSLIDKVHNTFVLDLHEIDEIEVTEHMVASFGEDFHESINFFFSGDVELDGETKMRFRTVGGEDILFESIGNDSDMKMLCFPEGAANCNIDIEFLKKLQAGTLSPEEQQELEESGFRFMIKTLENGDLHTTESYFEEEPTVDEDAAAKEGDLPDGYELAQNYPNPFNPTTTISYSIAEATLVTLEIFNVQGQKVRTLVDQFQSIGTHAVEWDAMTDEGHKVSSGIYLYRLSAGDVISSKKMNLLK